MKKRKIIQGCLISLLMTGVVVHTTHGGTPTSDYLHGTLQKVSKKAVDMVRPLVPKKEASEEVVEAAPILPTIFDDEK